MSTLGPSQRQAYDAACTGASLLITGSAGTGKSFLLKHIYSALTAQGKKVAITALTGCAAYLLTEDLGIKVNTIHSWVGFGYGEDTALSYIRAINQKHPLRQRWRATNTLIIDEISMMSAATFDKIEAIARGVRGKENAGKPFGGLQVICVGDFFQLPPVVKSGGASGPNAGSNPLFAFESTTWPTVIKHTIMLETIYRQRDPTFQKILEEARHGNLSEESVVALQERTTASWKKRTIKPTLIFTKRAVVDDINKRNIDVLKDPKYTYNVRTRIAPTNTIKGVQVLKEDEPIVKDAVAKLDNDANYIPSLTLCKKAQVMLIKNLDIKRGLVNGSRGVVTDFHPVVMSESVVSQEETKEPLKEENPQPVDSTIGVGAGTSTCAVTCTGRVETKNGFIETVRVHVTDPATAITTTKIITRTSVYFPLVLFVGQDEPILMEYNYWASTIEPSVSREQIPLALAWAVTTHKIQGATLDCALIDIGSDVFEYGQAYVALSRVKSLDALFVHNLEPSCVRAHPIVKDYYAAISTPKTDENNAADPTTDETVVTEERPDTIPPKKFFSIFHKK